MIKNLFCFSRENFDRFIIDNKWSDIDLGETELIGGPEEAFISICELKQDNLDSKWNQPIFSKQHPNLLILHFEDIDPREMKEIARRQELLGQKCNLEIYEEKPGYWIYKYTDTKKNLRIFDQDDAIRVLEFLKIYKGKNIYLHCFGGFSRSQAIVKFLLDTLPGFYKTESLNPCNMLDEEAYNRWVYDLLVMTNYKYGIL